MSGYISDGDSELPIFKGLTGNKIIIITAGFITINAFAGHFQSGNLWIVLGQKDLLDFFGQFQRMTQPIALFLSFPQRFFG